MDRLGLAVTKVMKLAEAWAVGAFAFKPNSAPECGLPRHCLGNSQIHNAAMG